MSSRGLARTLLPALAAAAALAAPAAAPGSQDAYVVDFQTGAVRGYDVEDDGTLTEFPSSPFGGGTTSAEGVAVSPDGRHAFVVYSDDEELLSYVRSADGSLEPAPGSPGATGGGPYGIAMTPDSRFVYTSNTSDDDVSGFAISSDGSLEELPGSPFPADTNPTGLAMSADGTRLYVATLNATVVAYAVGDDGALDELSGSPYPTGEDPYATVLAPDGDHLYVAARGSDNAVNVFAVEADGSLTDLASPAATEDNPFGLTITPDGEHVYTGNAGGNSISAFEVEADGTLTELAASPYERAVDINHLTTDAAGRYLYAGNASNDEVTAFSIAGDGELTELADSPFDGAPGDFQAIALSPEQGPAPAFAATGSGQTVDFDASQSRTDDPFTLRWDFGDGTTSEGGLETNHRYGAPGTYAVTLTLAESGGPCEVAFLTAGQTPFCNGLPTASVTQDVVVAADPSPPIVTPAPGGGPLPPDVTKPIIASLGFSRARFRAAPRGATIAAARVGTRVRLTVSEAATGAFRVQRRTIGRRAGGRCVARRRSNTRRRRCVRWVRKGSFSVPLRQGANAFTYRARHSARRLRPGRYRMIAVARDAAGNVSAPRRRGFRIV
ncbi:MAG TPA: beta-propeller fold lactonase family protein, partial [Solirubrobacteraceae bacterium]